MPELNPPTCSDSSVSALLWQTSRALEIVLGHTASEADELARRGYRFYSDTSRGKAAWVHDDFHHDGPIELAFIFHYALHEGRDISGTEYLDWRKQHYDRLEKDNAGWFATLMSEVTAPR